MKALVAALILPLATAGCSGPERPGVTVLAASSLKVPFERLETAFEKANPGSQITVNFAGSAELVTQIQQGARADVLATADEATMDSSELTGAQIFATNTMSIVVPADNPGNVTGLADLERPELLVVVCAPQVPCGAATSRIEASSGIDIWADSEESSVTDVLGKVRTGEADAGIVYASDVQAASPQVKAISIPVRYNTVNRYPIALVSEDPQARAFIDLVLSPQGRRVLRETGFGPP